MPGSAFFSNWNFKTGDLCTFNGVTCNSNNTKVTKLYLGGYPGLTGRLDPFYLNMTSITELAVIPGTIDGTLPESLSSLTSLTLLSITGNLFRGEIPASIGNLRNLKTLDLSCNRLTGSIPWQIGGLPALTRLALSGNLLSGSVPVFLTQTLITVDLTANNLTGGLPVNAFPPSIQYLSLPRNQLSGSVYQILSRLNKLKYLDLGINQFTGGIPASIFSLPSITSLRLDRNIFSGELPSTVGQVNINVVDLSYNGFSGGIPPGFSVVTSLSVNNNQLTGEVPSEFLDRVLSSHIKLLDLRHNLLRSSNNLSAVIPAEGAAWCWASNSSASPTCSPEDVDGKFEKRPTELCKVG
ncbi:unnamed protein product [Cuscuta europaea]|uniref:Leucine-rich repeat-containing N-terminal plant-type domain-containing protein n=1 Tax=Cuscuta europaea TaxID=41803 RepID=A0A9P1EFY9_CUSEU|nr:unnamed protein product [Cuscuta europaea]